MFRRIAFGRGPFLVLAICLLAGPPVHAQSESTLSLREAIARTLDASPQLAVLPLRERALSSRVDGAGLRPAPEVSLELENFLGSGELRGLSAVEATFAISQVVELGEQRARRVALAQQGLRALDVEREITQLDLMAEVARRYIHVAVDEQELELAELAGELAQRTLREVERRVESARAPVADLHRARAALMRTEIDHEHAEHELISAQRSLAAMWGASTVDFGGLDANLLSLPDVGDLDAFVARMSQSPDFLRYLSRARQHEAEAALAKAQARPAIALSVGVRRLQRDDDTAFVAGVAMPLFGTRLARPLIAEAEALQAEAEAQGRAALVEAEAVLFRMAQELQHAVTEASMLRDRVRPEIDAALQATERAWRAGRSSYLEWTDVQRERIDVERSLIQAAASAHLFRTEIERLTGATAADPAAQISSQGAPR